MGIKCPKCQFNNPDDSVYCGKCAAPLKSSEEISATKTLEPYEQFLDLWKDADPGIAEVEDARKRLAGLKR